jgi:hydrogenase-1 operon protein HyaF
MSIEDIPVRVVGPGSQPLAPDEQQLDYLEMPNDMAQYVAPIVPEPEDVEGLGGARQAMEWLREALRAFEVGDPPLIANLDALDKDNRDLVNQILGEGEVSITRSGRFAAKTQEAVLAGVWRTLYFDDEGRIVHDVLEVADAPHVMHVDPADGARIDVTAAEANPAIANALPLLVELESRCALYTANGTPHSLNLSLLPLSEAELEYLDERLGRGPVDLLSRSYGKCQVISTRVPNVWWVRYYNSMGTPILNSIEVVDVPEVVKAAAEDLHDSAVRLDEILAPYWSDVA